MTSDAHGIGTWFIGDPKVGGIQTPYSGRDKGLVTDRAVPSGVAASRAAP